MKKLELGPRAHATVFSQAVVGPKDWSRRAARERETQRMSRLLPVLVVFAMTAPACNGLLMQEAGHMLGRDHVTGPAARIPADNGRRVGDGPGNGGAPSVGPSCRSEDTEKLCLGVKYVVYKDDNGTPVVPEQDAVDNIVGINSVYGQCGVGFQIDQYTAIDPVDFGLRYRTATYRELDDIRKALGDDTKILLVTTGSWDRTGTLGNTSANAWTSLPDGDPYGAILEKPVGKFSNIIAHELGHYMNLLHLNDRNNLMNPIIYTASTKLSDAQCKGIREAASQYWSRMLR